MFGQLMTRIESCACPSAANDSHYSDTFRFKSKPFRDIPLSAMDIFVPQSPAFFIHRSV